jgi:hypothetical protein
MADRFWVGGTGTWNSTDTTKWSTTSGGASGASVPGSGDVAIFDQAATYTVSFSYSSILSVQTISNTAGTVTFAATASFGIFLQALTLTATAVWSSTSAMTFGGTGSFTIDTKGVVLGCSVLFNSSTATWTLASDFAVGTSRNIAFDAGTISLASFSLRTPVFNSTNTFNRTIAFGTGKIVITGSAAGTVVNLNALALGLSGSKRLDISRTSGTCSINTASTELNVYVTSGAYALTINSATIGALICTGYTGALSFTAFMSVRGNIVLGTGMSIPSSSSYITVTNTSGGTRTITSNGVLFGCPLLISSTGAGAWQLVDALSVGGSLGYISFSGGTLDLNNQAVSALYFEVPGTSTRTLAMGTSTITLTGTGGWSHSGVGLSITGTGTIRFNNTVNSTFAGGGYQGYPTVTHTGTGQLTISGNNKFTNFTVVPTTGNTVRFTGGSTNQFTSSFSMSGASGTLATLVSTNTTQAVLRQSGTWFMGANSTNGGNNTNLVFTAGGSLDYLAVSYIYGAGPPTTYASSVDDSTTALDTTSASKPVAGEVTDTAAAADSLFTISPVDAGFADLVTASISIGANEVNLVSVSETAAAQDVGAAGANLLSGTTNTATAADAAASTFAIPSTLLETARPTDVATSTKTMPANASDIVTARDTPSALAVLRSAVSDTAAARDLPFGSTVYVAAVADTARGSDAVSVAFLVPASVSDTARTSDATSRVVIQLVTGSVAEGASAGEVVTVLPSTFTVLMIEGATAQDILQTRATFQASLSDGVLVVDANAAAYLWNLIDDSQTPNWQNASTVQTPGWQDVNDAQSPGWTSINQ